MISKQQKKEIIEELADKFSRQKAAVFSDYTGLTVNQAQELRNKLREQGIDYKVAKKSLIDLALKQAGLGEGAEARKLDGQISVSFGYGDEVLPAKILRDFAKTNENLKVLAGFVQGEYMDSDGMAKLAAIPSRNELLAKAVGSISSPISGLLNAFQGNIRNLVYILSNIKPGA